jgi:translation initiation factor IF-2
LEVVKAEIGKVKTEKIITKVVHAGVGEITESDIMLAKAGGAVIVGFDVAIKNRITKKADQERIKIIEDAVIYKLSEAILEIIENRDQAENKEVIHGSLKVKAVFASNKIMAVVGGEVVEGKAKSIAHLRQFRNIVDEDGEKAEKMMGTCSLETLQQGTDSVGEIAEGVECGLKIKHNGLIFEVGDRLEFFSPAKK